MLTSPGGGGAGRPSWQGCLVLSEMETRGEGIQEADWHQSGLLISQDSTASYVHNLHLLRPGVKEIDRYWTYGRVFFSPPPRKK